MLPPPTRFERRIHMRINLRVFRVYIGTGHHLVLRRQRLERGEEETDCEDEDSSPSESDA